MFVAKCVFAQTHFSFISSLPQLPEGGGSGGDSRSSSPGAPSASGTSKQKCRQTRCEVWRTAKRKSQTAAIPGANGVHELGGGGVSPHLATRKLEKLVARVHDPLTRQSRRW